MLGVLAVLSWAVEEEEVAVIRYGLLTLKIWQADDSARKVELTNRPSELLVD